MKKLVLVILTSIFLAGCNTSTYDKAMEQAKLALANGEFDKALASFELALDEKPKDEEAKALYENLVAFNQVKEDSENAKWDDVITKANNLLKEETLASSIKKELEQYIKIAEASKEKYKDVSEKVEKIKNLVSEKNYSEAQKFISELKEDESIEEVFNDFSKEVNNIEVKVNEEIIKQKAEAAKEKEKAEAVESKKQEISWSTYSNPRFGFHINYPSDWILGPEPTNGDGRVLYQGNDAEIGASASYYMEESKPDLSNYEEFNTNFGEDAYLIVQNNESKVTLDGYIIKDEIEFHLWGSMNKDFYQNYSDILQQMLLNVKLD